MKGWSFPSRAGGGTEGFSNAGLAEFKGNPLQSLAREICQNSLDAADGTGRPVRIEFHKKFMKILDFPGMDQMEKILDSCQRYWGQKGDAKTKSFLKNASSSIKKDNFFVLRVSDFNTKGVQGAFSPEDITPWGSLVKGNSFSVKSDEKNAAGSYGIGKAAPFVSSEYQTVFYRTYDIDNQKAALGVTRLMAHENVTNELLPGEDSVRRAEGYYGEDLNRNPAKSIPELDNIYKREEHGTDIFIPGFCFSTSDEEWVKDILSEIVENFLYSIYSGKLEIVVEKRILSKATLPAILSLLGSKAKNARMFYEVINTDNNNVQEINQNFMNLGNLRLRLVYADDLNKKILVVRNSGMKISNIPSLPRGISYTGFLELQGDDLNEFFRKMENPKHNAWEPSRHDNKDLAKQYKELLEEWVRNAINEKLVEMSGEESAIDIGDCFNYKEAEKNENKDERKQDLLVDTVKNIEIIAEPVERENRIRIIDEGGSKGESRTPNNAGKIDDKGTKRGHRTRTGSQKGGKPSGRKGHEDANGNDKIYGGRHEVYVSARIISKGNGKNRLIFIAEEEIQSGDMEIVTKGENGKTLQLYVLEANGNNVRAKDGRIVVSNIPVDTKQTVEFKIAGNRSYAMGVKAYGN